MKNAAEQVNELIKEQMQTKDVTRDAAAKKQDLRKSTEMQQQVVRFLAVTQERADGQDTPSLPLSEPLPAPTERDSSDYNHRLPPTFTRFFGREDELARLVPLLKPSEEPPRLITLTGPGGAGKTRLAVAAGQRLWELYPDNLWYVPLADLTDAECIRTAVEGIGVSVRNPNTGEVTTYMPNNGMHRWNVTENEKRGLLTWLRVQPPTFDLPMNI